MSFFCVLHRGFSSRFIFCSSDCIISICFILTDKEHKGILNLPDAFADMKDDIEASQAKTLQAQLNTGNPMTAGKTYQLNVKFFDKKNPGNEIIANVDLTMKE